MTEMITLTKVQEVQRTHQSTILDLEKIVIDLEKALDPLKKQAQRFGEEAKLLSISNKSEREKTLDVLANMKTSIALMEKGEKEFFLPYKDFINKGKKSFDEIVSQAKSAYDLVRDKFDKFMRKELEKEEKRLAAEREEARIRQEQYEIKAQEKAMQGKEIPSPPPPVEISKKASAEFRSNSAQINTTITWKAEIINEMDLIKAIADGKVPVSIIKFDMGAINKAARGLEDKLNWPGVRTYKDVNTQLR